MHQNGQVMGAQMRDKANNPDKKPQDAKDKPDVRPLVDEVIDEYKNTGITTITERRVVIGPDGRRRVLSRRKVVNTPPEEREQK